MTAARSGLLPEVAALIRAVRRQAGPRFWRVLAVQALAVLTEGVGLVLLLPILQLAQEETGGAPALMGLDLPIPAALRGLEALLLLFVLVIAAQAALNRWRALFVARVTFDFVGALRADLFRALTGARWEALVRLRRAEAEQMLLVESERVTVSVSLLFSLVQALASIAVTVTIAALLSPAMLLVAGGLGLVALAVVWPSRGRSAAAGERLLAGRAGQQRLVSAVMTGLKAMRAAGLEGTRREAFAGAVGGAREALLAYVRLTSATAGILQVAFAAAAATFVWTALRVAGLDLPTVVIFLAVLLRLAPRMAGLQGQVQQLGAEISAYRATRAFAARLAAERDPSVDAPRRPPPPLREAVRVEGLRVRLAGVDAPAALDGVTLELPAGRTTALVGPSGSGKTTLADVVAGILSPTEGAVLVDGRPLRDEDRAAWRGGVAYVAQDPVLMRDTVRENLREAAPAATDADLAQALGDAVADALVAGLPGGLDAPVGERGALLSGGERQRLAIAQALLRRPQLLVLDEATSGLDWDTQGRLAANLSRVAAERGMTTLIVAHRPEAIRHADLVHVLDQGRLVESGTPAALAARGGAFAAGLLASPGREDAAQAVP